MSTPRFWIYRPCATWDQNFGVTANVAEVYIAYLRKKVDAPGEPKLIRTVRGRGTP
jgi:DNA-binding response OmpR family regulator